MARDPLDSFAEVYVQALHDQTAAVFAGAGLSIPAGLVNWKELLKDIASDVGRYVGKRDRSQMGRRRRYQRLRVQDNRVRKIEDGSRERRSQKRYRGYRHQ